MSPDLVDATLANLEEASWLAYHVVMSAFSAWRQEVPTSILTCNECETDNHPGEPLEP